jgi:hypothetical protein
VNASTTEKQKRFLFEMQINRKSAHQSPERDFKKELFFLKAK